MKRFAPVLRFGRICLAGSLALVFFAAGCGSDKLRKETEEKNKVIAEYEEYKKKAEADLAAKDQELRTVVEKLQRQNADVKRQLDNCGATVAELRDKVKTASKQTAKTDSSKSAKSSTAKTQKAPAKRPGR
jgi:hypothetical protein